MYILTFLRVILSVIIAAVGLIPTALGFDATFGSPAVIFDASELEGEVTSGASGYLYGIAEDGVPSYNMVESLDISSVSAKTQGGLQHPIGEVGDVAPSLIEGGSCDYIVVYLQDMYSTWYYDNAAIDEAKAAGTYDWKTYLKDTYFPMIEQTVNEMKDADYSDKLVYCIFNECDNGVWFGEWITDGENGWNSFNEQGMDNFNEAWKMTYDYVRSLDPDALIGGPGNYEYSSTKTDYFLKYASENNCVPDVIIYHELGDRSIYDWEENVKDLESIESKYGISTDTPVIVTEYGRMQDNGDPNTMLKYIVRSEYSGVYSNQAYWLLANNLSNTCADYNTPNSAWWVYRWYTNMQGQLMSAEISDVLHSDLEKSIKEKREPRYQQYLGMGTLSDSDDKLDIIVAGADYKGRVVVKNLDETELYGKNVKIEITAITYQGLTGQVTQPETVEIYTKKCSSKLSIPLDMDEDTAYHITVTLSDEEIEYENENLYVRFEAEDGELLNNAYTYDSAYATTGEDMGMVGGMENEGQGVKIPVKVPADGTYELRVIYGNSNDGQTSADRVDTLVNFSVDEGEKSVVALPNTIKSELTGTYDMTLELTKGTHYLTFTHNKGTYVLDSILVRQARDDNTVYTEKDDDRENSYLVIAETDGYYLIKTDADAEITVDGAAASTDAQGAAVVYLRRGLNYIDLPANATLKAFTTTETGASVTLLTKDASLADSAQIQYNASADKYYITGISSEGGSADYTVTVPADGTYKITICYSNNRENGVHSYNVDLVEDYITISVNGEKQFNLYCRNTYSADTYTTVTANIGLKAGENVITFSNDGANRFNNTVSYAPDIAEVTINPTMK
ncbi:MAG: hypothetical protein IJZ35_06930 [Clostridia bacterium]|nr:hypothetical protein [Clostridia bacterium]